MLEHMSYDGGRRRHHVVGGVAPRFCFRAAPTIFAVCVSFLARCALNAYEAQSGFSVHRDAVCAQGILAQVGPGCCPRGKQGSLAGRCAARGACTPCDAYGRAKGLRIQRRSRV